VWLLAILVPGELLGGEGAPPSPGISTTPSDVGLTVHEGWLSLRAQNTSLKAIVEAIGQQLSIAVVARIPADERITLACERLSLTDALTRLRPYVNTLVVEDAKAPGTIRQRLVISKRLADTPVSQSTPDGDGDSTPSLSQGTPPTPASTTRPQPFRFEFDPTTGGGRGR
jgi:hypothetical protein